MKLVPFSWFGGKSALLNHILPKLRVDHQTFVDSFGGSAAVTLNKEASPVEIYNDLHGDVCNFFRSLRDHTQELISAIELTPYSREEYVGSLERGDVNDIERARRFFITARQVIMGLATSATPGRWCVGHKQSRRGMALVVSRWLSATEGLMDVASRFKQIIIENENAITVIERYDSDETLHYVDPPYPMATRSGGKAYKFEFNDTHHEQLLKLLLSCKGKVAISTYENPLYERLLADWHCYFIRGDSHSARYHDGVELKRRECLWTNYEAS